MVVGCALGAPVARRGTGAGGVGVRLGGDGVAAGAHHAGEERCDEDRGAAVGAVVCRPVAAPSALLGKLGF